MAGDGTLAAIVESTRVTIVALLDGSVVAEVGIDDEAVASDSMWVGTPPRLLVLSRFAAHSTVHLLDPDGPRKVAEIRLESAMQLVASVSVHALAMGSIGAAVLTVSGTGSNDAHLTPYRFPARTVPLAVGVAAAQFLVALPGTVEEWDPVSRSPRRRMRLPRPSVITAVGGSERLVWVTTQQDPVRIDVMPLVNRGQPKTHELPEPIAAISGHPRSDLVVCIGAETGRLYAVDLDGRTRLRVMAAEGIDRIESAALVVGRAPSVIVAQAGRPLAILPLDPREVEPTTARASVSVLALAPAVEDPPGASTLAAPAAPTAASAREPTAPAFVAASPDPAPPGDWRDRMRQSQQCVDPLIVPTPTPMPTPIPTPTPPVSIDAQRSWRDATVVWARSVVAGASSSAPSAPLIAELATRFELSSRLVPALVLLYGMHLAGEPGAAPVDVTRVLGGTWDEALGRGQLAALGLVTFERSRVILAAPIVTVLDERAPVTGTLVCPSGGWRPGPTSLLGPCVVIADDTTLERIAEQHLPRIGGPILVAHTASDPGELFVEARARGAAPMLRVWSGQLEQLPPGPAILVVSDEQLASELGVPRLG